MYYYLIISMITFLLFYIDKRKAIKQQYRISEKTLFLFILIGGCIGALYGMKLFRHKTKHINFYILSILSLFLHIYIYLTYIR